MPSFHWLCRYCLPNNPHIICLRSTLGSLTACFFKPKPPRSIKNWPASEQYDAFRCTILLAWTHLHSNTRLTVPCILWKAFQILYWPRKNLQFWLEAKKKKTLVSNDLWKNVNQKGIYQKMPLIIHDIRGDGRERIFTICIYRQRHVARMGNVKYRGRVRKHLEFVLKMSLLQLTNVSISHFQMHFVPKTSQTFPTNYAHD